jgi:hypothetical protein
VKWQKDPDVNPHYIGINLRVHRVYNTISTSNKVLKHKMNPQVELGI